MSNPTGNAWFADIGGEEAVGVCGYSWGAVSQASSGGVNVQLSNGDWMLLPQRWELGNGDVEGGSGRCVSAPSQQFIYDGWNYSAALVSTQLVPKAPPPNDDYIQYAGVMLGVL